MLRGLDLELLAKRVGVNSGRILVAAIQQPAGVATTIDGASAFLGSFFVESGQHR